MANYNTDRLTIGENTYRVKDTVSDYATNTALANKQDKIENLSYVAMDTLERTTNKVTSWSATTTDTNYPSEKLVKDSLDAKAASSHTHTKSQITDFDHTHTKSEITDFSHTHTKSEITDFDHTHTKSQITDFSHTHTTSEITDFPTLATVATSGSYNDLTNKPDIPSDVVKYVAQSLADSQKIQARANIDAASVGQVNNVAIDLDALKDYTVTAGTPIGTDIATYGKFTKETGYNGLVQGEEPYGIQLNQLASYDTYYMVATEDVDLYFAAATQSTYLAFCHGDNYTGIQEITSTQKVLKSSNVVRKRSSESNLPTASAKFHVDAGDVFSVTIPTGTTATIYGLETAFGIGASLKADVIEAVNEKKSFCTYETGSFDDNASARLNVYIDNKQGTFTHYQFLHSVNSSTNADIWRMGRAYKTTSALADSVELITTGEWECAVKISGRSDFSGGILHGDEVMDDIKVFVDGVKTEFSSLSAATQFDTLRIVQTSNLYDPNDSTTIIAKHGSEHIFDDKGVTINQSIKWIAAYTLANCFMAMLPAKKTAFSGMYTDKDYDAVDLANIPFNYAAPVTAASLYSITGDNFVTFEIPKYPYVIADTNGAFSCQDNGGEAYYKCYYYITGDSDAYVTEANEEWHSSTRYEIRG